MTYLNNDIEYEETNRNATEVIWSDISEAGYIYPNYDGIENEFNGKANNLSFNYFSKLFDNKQDNLYYYLGRFRDSINGGLKFKIEALLDNIYIYVWFYRKQPSNSSIDFVDPDFIDDSWEFKGWGPRWRWGAPVFYKKKLLKWDNIILDFTKKKSLLLGFGIIPENVDIPET